MQTYIFGDAFLAGRTKRACGGNWIDIDSHELPAEDSLFIEAGSVMRPFAGWKTDKAILAIGATLEEPRWDRYFKSRSVPKIPRGRTFFLSASAIKKLNRSRKKLRFWEALENLEIRTWVEPQLRNWHFEGLRVLQVVTSLQSGGAERVCLELAKMPECVGIVSWFSAGRTSLRTPDWDFSTIHSTKKVSELIILAQKLNVDVIHTHLLSAPINREIANIFPLVTTIHNTPEAWPPGYETDKPGLVVGCSSLVTKHLGSSARVAWNGVSMKLTKKPKVNAPKEIRLIAVANFRSQKRLEKLPSIVLELRKNGYRPLLTIVGEVNDRDADSVAAHALLWNTAKKLNVFRYIKQVKTTDVQKELAKNHVFISTSKHEGLSLAHLEALAAGLPVVATNVGGASEIRNEVKDGAYALLAPNATAKTFAAAILIVWKTPRKDRLPQAFTSHAMRKRYRFLYDSCLAKGATRNEVWLVTNNFSMGGAQSSARRLMHRWNIHQRVKVFILKENQPSRGTLDLIKKGISVISVNAPSAVERVKQILQHAAEGSPQAVLFWNAMPADKCLIADAIVSPVIDVSPGAMYFKEMENYLQSPLPELPIRTSQEYGRLLKAGVVKYQREEKRMETFLHVPTVVIPNGVEGIEPVKRRFDKPLVFGTAARLSPQKRLEDLLKAFSSVEAPLLMAGSVEPGSNDYAQQLKLLSGTNVTWLGEQEINSFLKKIDIFVMISEPAGCPNASLEAMQSGLPMILTDVGGANEQVIDGLNGWLVPPTDTAKLAKAIKECLSFPQSTLQVMSKASLQHAKNFSMEKMLTRYQELVLHINNKS